ncbi:MAG: hypothetical protein DWQ49_09550 [Bacteroidetes bacterium]|nr:MAG: hypothetical protein DWQ49_09550 [Bacteroidota bacterium]
MINIEITETQGTEQVVGPNTFVQYNVSGVDNSDNITVNVSPAAADSVGVSITEAPDNISITGTDNGDSIAIKIFEGIQEGCFPSQFVYNSGGNLISKIHKGVTTNYTYYGNGFLWQAQKPDCTKTMFYDVSGNLTGISVI